MENCCFAFAKAYKDAGKLDILKDYFKNSLPPIFDGLPVITDDTPSTDGDGMANPAFPANIDAGIADYLVNTLKINTFKNTNFICGVDDFVPSGNTTMPYVNLTNVSFTGDCYRNGLMFQGDYRGVISFEGESPWKIDNRLTGAVGKAFGYLKLKKASMPMGFADFAVIDAGEVNKGSNNVDNGVNIGALRIVGGDAAVNVVVLPTKNAVANTPMGSTNSNPNAALLKPNCFAVPIPNGEVVHGLPVGSLLFIPTAIRVNYPVPSLNYADWETAAIDGNDNETNTTIYPWNNFSAVPSTMIWPTAIYNELE